MLATQTLYAEPAVPPTPPPGNITSGAQLQRDLEMLERYRVGQQIQDDIQTRKAKNVVDKTRKTQEKTLKEVNVTVTKINYNKSKVFSDNIISDIVKDYVNRQVSIGDLYNMVERINDLYTYAGYITCKAFLPQQEVKNGVIRILLVEGYIGNINILGNKTTKEGYIIRRWRDLKGKVATLKKINDKVIKFNGTNDIQLKLMLQAGEKSGTTDFLLTAYEPQRFTHTLFADNLGGYSNSPYRYGYFLNARSLSGMRDNLSMGYTRTLGSNSFNANYEFPLGPSGAKFSVGYSTNATEIVKGSIAEEGTKIKGHSTAYTAALRQPWIVNKTTRSEVGLEFSNQTSKTTFEGMHWADDQVRDLVTYFSHTGYGDSHVYYQKLSFTPVGSYRNITGTLNENNIRHFNYTGYYQKTYASEQLLVARFDAQYNVNEYLPSLRHFYVGGGNSVRGYRESFLSGERGWSASVEYQLPKEMKVLKHSPFVFFDYGHVGGASALESHFLKGTGVGLKGSITKNLYSSFTFAFPLVHHVSGEEVGRTRIHYTLSFSF